MASLWDKCLGWLNRYSTMKEKEHELPIHVRKKLKKYQLGQIAVLVLFLLGISSLGRNLEFGVFYLGAGLFGLFYLLKCMQPELDLHLKSYIESNKQAQDRQGKKEIKESADRDAL